LRKTIRAHNFDFAAHFNTTIKTKISNQRNLLDVKKETTTDTEITIIIINCDIFETPDIAIAEPSIYSREAGSAIDFNEQQCEKDPASIRFNFEPESNFTEESDVHP
jgi:hypothetical protein